MVRSWRLYVALAYSALASGSSQTDPSNEQLAKSGWPELPEGQQPMTIVVPGTLNVRICEGNCRDTKFSVLQDGGYRATSPEPQGRMADDGMSLISTYNGDNRFYIGQLQLAESSDPVTHFKKDDVAVFDLTNKVWEFDVDLSNVGCNCDASMYFYSYAPSSSQTGPATGPMRNRWYLDAQSIPGVPEMDVMESCGKGWTSSIHTCKAEVNGSYSGCSGLGEMWRAMGVFEVIHRKYGPSGTKIDTAMPLHVAAAFRVDGDQWSMEVTLSQASAAGVDLAIKSHFRTEARADASSLRWMRPALSLWGNPSNGLHMATFFAPQCSPFHGCAYKTAKVKYSNFTITNLPLEDFVLV